MPAKIIVAVKALIQHGDQFLIVQRAKGETAGAGDWECPGGKLNFGETLEEALAREVCEETGLAVTAGPLLCATTFQPHTHVQCVMLTYMCQADRMDIVLSNEHQAFKWLSRSALPCYLPQTIWRKIDEVLT